jgi:hypothetical protein
MKPLPNPQLQQQQQQQHFPPSISAPPLPVQPPLPAINIHQQHSQPPPPINYQVPPPHGPPARFIHNQHPNVGSPVQLHPLGMMPMQAQLQHNMYNNKAQPMPPRFHNPNPAAHFQHPVAAYPIVMGHNPNLVMVSGGMQPQHNIYGQNLQYDNMGKFKVFNEKYGIFPGQINGSILKWLC